MGCSFCLTGVLFPVFSVLFVTDSLINLVLINISLLGLFGLTQYISKLVGVGVIL